MGTLRRRFVSSRYGASRPSLRITRLTRPTRSRSHVARPRRRASDWFASYADKSDQTRTPPVAAPRSRRDLGGEGRREFDEQIRRGVIDHLAVDIECRLGTRENVLALGHRTRIGSQQVLAQGELSAD
jgi:hypothetical protein